MSVPKYVILSLTITEAVALRGVAEIGGYTMPDDAPMRHAGRSALKHLTERIEDYLTRKKEIFKHD